jgi:hypothetical protein
MIHLIGTVFIVILFPFCLEAKRKKKFKTRIFFNHCTPENGQIRPPRADASQRELPQLFAVFRSLHSI